jgi:multicomponent K+:H+ antiporter subunit A
MALIYAALGFIALFGGVFWSILRQSMFRWYAGLPSVDAKLIFERGIVMLLNVCNVTHYLRMPHCSVTLALLLCTLLLVVTQRPEFSTANPTGHLD